MIRFLLRLITKLIGEERLLYYAAGEFNRRIFGLKHYGYLHDEGWITSFKTKTAIDKNGEPMPWLSYPLLDFLKPRLNNNMVLFEYGGGNSTLFYSNHVKEVYTVESDKQWYEIIKNPAKQNTHIYYEPIDETPVEYIEKPGKLNKKFHLIIVDGMNRNECLLFCKDQLEANGVIIADDTNQYNYGSALAEIEKMGFKRLDFWGIASFVIDKKSTTIFYRENNCLGI